jgi:hypothetical protein
VHITRHSTVHSAAHSTAPRTTCVSVPMTMLGLLASSPAALRRSCHRRFMASPPSSTASDEPTVSVPVGGDADKSAGDRHTHAQSHTATHIVKVLSRFLSYPAFTNTAAVTAACSSKSVTHQHATGRQAY